MRECFQQDEVHRYAEPPAVQGTNMPGEPLQDGMYAQLPEPAETKIAGTTYDH